MTSISTNPTPASPLEPETLHDKSKVELADAAAVLLPGLRHARSLLDVAIQLLARFANQPPQAPPGQAAEVAKIRRMLAEFGHPAVRR
ncbi:MAG: hypothetical protein WDO56_14295 [Gammaproteobacteria bacterium]